MPNERLESAYWVCAYANNQWELGEAIADDPGKTTSTERSPAQGTVAVLFGGHHLLAHLVLFYLRLPHLPEARLPL